MQCPLCQREVVHPSAHHLIPKSRGGGPEQRLVICRDCHQAIHELFANQQLERDLHTVERLLADDRFLRMVRFIAKQDPAGKVKFPRRRRY